MRKYILIVIILLIPIIVYGADVVYRDNAGLSCSTTGSNFNCATASSEAAFLADAALTCGAGTEGKIQIHTTPLQYCDSTATPVLRYAAFGDSAGAATSGDTATSFFSLGTIEHERGGLELDVSAFSGLLSIDSGSTTSVDNSAELAARISDETGTGLLTFATAPTFTTSISFNATTDTIAGVQNQNIVDKTSAEVISGVWEIQDDVNFAWGNDADIQVRYDETTDNRWEIHDGTNLLMHLTDAGTTGNLVVTGNLTVSNNSITLGSDAVLSGGSTASLDNIEAIDATTETTFEAAIDSLSNLTVVGALNSGSIATGFGDIDIGTSDFRTGGQYIIDIDGTAENAAGSLTMGAGSDAGLFFNGTNAVLITNGAGGGGIVLDAEDDTLEFLGSGVLQATLDLDGIDIITGNDYEINGASVLTATTLGSAVVNSSLTSLGTIATGTWEGTTIAVNQGGTGQTSYTNGQLLIGNTTGNTLAKATITGGDAVDTTNGTGSITLDVVPLTTEADGGLTVQEAGGLEISNDAIALLQGCSDNQILKWDETEDDWNCEADATGAGVDPGFDNAGDPIVLQTTTKDVQIGAAQINTSKLSVDGDADQVQFSIAGHSTQTTNIVTIETSAGTDLMTLTNSGNVDFLGIIRAGSGNTTIVNGDGSLLGASLGNNGDVVPGAVDLTNDWDFGGASSFEIPNGAGPTVNATGEIAFDTTGDQLLVYNGTDETVLVDLEQKCAILENLAAADDNFEIFMANKPITITNIGCHCRGTCTTKAQISLEDRSGNAMTHTTPTCSETTGNTTYQSVTSGNSLSAGEGLRFDVDNAVSPETDAYTICFTYRTDRE